MTTAAPWPPRVGELLPRAREAFAEPQKLRWILSAEGHGREWARVLRIGPQDTAVFWEAIGMGALEAPIFKVNDRAAHGIGCAIHCALIIGRRTARARIAWHHKHAFDAPRLVTAYPRP